MPMDMNLPTPSSSGNANFKIPSSRKTQPTSKRISTIAELIRSSIVASRSPCWRSISFMQIHIQIVLQRARAHGPRAFGRLEIAFPLHAVQQRVKGPRTGAVAVTSEFADHFQTKYVFFAGMVKDMQSNKREMYGTMF